MTQGTNSRRCGFELDPSEYEFGRRPEFTQVWRCPRETYDEQEDYCIFHLDNNTKEEKNITPNEVNSSLLDIVNGEDSDDYRFYGAKFRQLRLTSCVLNDGRSNQQIIFDFSTIDVLFITGATIQHPLSLSNCDIEIIQISQSDFYKTLELSESTFSINTEFDSFPEDSQFAGKMAEVYLSTSNFENFRCINAEFHNDLVFAGCEVTKLNLTDCEFHRNVAALSSDIDDFSYSKTIEYETQSILNIEDSTISRARIDVPVDGSRGVHFIECSVGKISLRPEGENNPFEVIRFENTEFTEFDFPRYSEFLSEIGWILHPTDELPDSSNRTEYLNANQENTYTRAKAGANRVGDNYASSQFLINELRCRRKQFKEYSRDNPLTTQDGIFWRLRYLSNLVMDKSSRYGESPIRVFGISFVIILIWGVLYPTIGGIREINQGSSTIHKIIWSLPDISNLTEVGDLTGSTIVIIWKSVYFSAVTFTTLGYGDYQPAGWIAELLAASESFIGAFLIALFVYSLGKQVSR